MEVEVVEIVVEVEVKVVRVLVGVSGGVVEVEARAFAFWCCLPPWVLDGASGASGGSIGRLCWG